MLRRVLLAALLVLLVRWRRSRPPTWGAQVARLAEMAAESLEAAP